MAMSGSRASRTHGLRCSHLDGFQTVETFCGHRGAHDPEEYSRFITEDGGTFSMPKGVGDEPTCRICRRALGLPVTTSKPAKCDRLDPYADAVLFATGHLPEDF